MAGKEIVNGCEVRTIKASDGITCAAFVPELGAIGSSLVMPGPDGPRETLFRHDFFWDRATDQTRGGSPFLFPVCGRLERNGQAETYLYEEQLYKLKIHGFAQRMPWHVTAAEDPAQLVLELSDTPETRACYPCEFALRLTLRVEPGVFVCEQHCENRGDRPMPYSAGYHPYFLTPAPDAGKAAVQLRLQPAHALVYNERLTDIAGTREAPRFPAAITEPDINERLLRMKSEKKAQLLFPDGFRLCLRAESDTDPDMFPYMQLYTMPDKPFFCVEPWMAAPNALNTVAGMRWLAPGQNETGRLRIWTETAKAS